MSSQDNPRAKVRDVPEKIKCPKCRAVNEGHKHHCSNCGAHLHIACRSCGSRNERNRSSCRECGQRLHRSAWQSISKKFFPKRARISVLQLVLLIVAVTMAYKVIIRLAEYQPPEPE